MKTKYIHVKRSVDIEPALKKAIPFLKGKVGIVTTIQFLHLMKDVKKFLDKNNVKSEILGQVLGCNADAAKNTDADTLLFFGDGLFHPIGIMLKQEKNIVIANPVSNTAKILSEKEMQKYKNIKQRGLTSFLSSKDVGVLVSMKPGQEQMKAALNLKKKYKDKNFYILLFDDLDFNQLENFPFIECFVNTMCPRIAYDDADKIRKPVIDFRELK